MSLVLPIPVGNNVLVALTIFAAICILMKMPSCRRLCKQVVTHYTATKQRALFLLEKICAKLRSLIHRIT